MGAPFLSIVVPFHNSEHSCAPLLDQLAQLGGSEGVELIFVDDGSTDSTPAVLHEFATRSLAAVQVIERSRGGPGAARNSGLDCATGEFVWFVDSDDTIDLQAIAMAKAAHWPDIDLVVWDWDHPQIAQRLSPGLHSTADGPAPPNVLDPIVCNWFSGPFLRRTGLRFPEFCFYEATPLEAFILPLLIERYLKVDFIAYRANTQTSSITRSGTGFVPHHYDSLSTIPLGMRFVTEARLDKADRARFDAAFIMTFLWYRIEIARTPGPSWVRAARVMRQYRTEAKRFGISLDPLSLYRGRSRSRRVMSLLWILSAALPPQERYFRQLRRLSWPREILWKPPAMPERYRRPGPTRGRPRSTDDAGTNVQAEAGS